MNGSQMTEFYFEFSEDQWCSLEKTIESIVGRITNAKALRIDLEWWTNRSLSRLAVDNSFSSKKAVQKIRRLANDLLSEIDNIPECSEICASLRYKSHSIREPADELIDACDFLLREYSRMGRPRDNITNLWIGDVGASIIKYTGVKRLENGKTNSKLISAVLAVFNAAPIELRSSLDDPRKKVQFALKSVRFAEHAEILTRLTGNDF
jgi:hypothetical protein